MRRLAVLAVLLAAIVQSALPDAPSWKVEVEWGNSPLLGSAISVTIDGDGHLRARKIGGPPTSAGEPPVYESRLSPPAAEHMRKSVRTAIQAVDPSKAQGSMVGDGGHIYVYLWDGTVALALQAHLLSEDSEAGPQLGSLLAEFRKLLPDSFEYPATPPNSALQPPGAPGSE